MVNGRPLLYFALETFLANDNISTVCVVLPERFINFKLPNHHKLLRPVVGGQSRHLSAFNGLIALQSKPHDRILVHDAARPLVPSELVSEVCKTLEEFDAVTPALPITEALIERDNLLIVDRARYGTVQTPQGFRGSILEKAFNRYESSFMPSGRVPSCEFELVRAMIPSASVKCILGHHSNFKITHGNDLANLLNFSCETRPVNIHASY
jgi:2-C-methyl-D-erythritol 4-phosphate cytidylyltransferase